MSRARIPRATTAVTGLVCLLSGLALPLLGPALAGGPAPFCRASGRCCCAGDEGAPDDRTCLRRGCGCEGEDATVDGAPLRVEVILPVATLLATLPASEARGEIAGERPLPRADAPPTPPPRRLLPA